MFGRMKAKTRMSAWQWSELVTAWEASGQSAASFADERGIAESALRRWKAEFARRSRRESARRLAGMTRAMRVPLARVLREGEALPSRGRPASVVGEASSAATAQSNGSIALVLDRVRVVVAPGFDAQLLREVVRALSERS